jgi:predicted glycosyltransferase
MIGVIVGRVEVEGEEMRSRVDYLNLPAVIRYITCYARPVRLIGVSEDVEVKSLQSGHRSDAIAVMQ